MPMSRADSAQVTPLVSAAVKAVPVVNTQVVRKGQILVVLDDSDARLALAKAEADYLKARRQFAQTAATSGSLAAQVSARDADIGQAQAQLAAAQANFDKARIDLSRRQELASSGAVSGEELTIAQERLFDCPVQPRARPRRRRHRVGNPRRRTRELGRQRGADRRLDGRHQPRSRRRQGEAGPGPARSRAHGHPRADRRRRHQPPGPGRPAHLRRLAGDDHRSGEQRLRRRQLQGRPAGQGPPGPDGRAHLRPLRRGRRLPRPRRRLLRRHRLGVRADSGAERHRQLDQGGPAPARAHPARSQGTRSPPASRRPVDGSQDRRRRETS